MSACAQGSKCRVNTQGASWKISPLSHLTRLGVSCQVPVWHLHGVGVPRETNMYLHALRTDQSPPCEIVSDLLLTSQQTQSTQKGLLCVITVISPPGFTALSSRCLQLIVHYIPIIRAHFEARLQPKQFSMLRHFDHITKVTLLAFPETQSSAFQLCSEEHKCH